MSSDMTSGDSKTVLKNVCDNKLARLYCKMPQDFFTFSLCSSFFLHWKPSIACCDSQSSAQEEIVSFCSLCLRFWGVSGLAQVPNFQHIATQIPDKLVQGHPYRLANWDSAPPPVANAGSRQRKPPGYSCLENRAVCMLHSLPSHTQTIQLPQVQWIILSCN